MKISFRQHLHLTGGTWAFPAFAMLIVLVFLMPFSTMILPSANGQVPDPVKVGYYNNRPVSYTSGSGGAEGFSIDLLRDLAGSEGWRMEFQQGTIEECIGWLEEGDVDLVAGLEKEDVRSDTISFSNETIISNWGLVYSAEDEDIDSIMDLEGKWIGVLKDDIFYNGTNGLRELLESFKIEAYLVRYDNYNEVIDAIEDGDVDAGVLNNLLGRAVEKERNIKRTGVVFNPVEIHYAFPPSGEMNEELRSEIDTYLRALKNDDGSLYYNLIEDYFSPGNGGVREILPPWLVNLVIIVLAVAFFLFVTTIFFRYRVRIRTRELRRANERLDRDIHQRIEVEKNLVEERNRSLFYLDLLIHDIGNIHQGLLTSTNLLRMVRDDHEKANLVQGKIEGLVERSINLVKNVQKYTMAKTSPIKRQPINLVPMVQKALSSVLLSFSDREVRTSFHSEIPGIQVIAEPLVEEVFYNIYHNAVNYQSADKAVVETRIRPSDNGKYVFVEISDHGPGIPDTMKSRLFNRPKEAKKGEHSGMGLSLVKALLDRYDSEVKVYDRVPGDQSKGTTFTIIIPVYRPV
ncbi:MAG: ATP-binding protein [Thermoplasmatota archaeon]